MKIQKLICGVLPIRYLRIEHKCIYINISCSTFIRFEERVPAVIYESVTTPYVTSVSKRYSVIYTQR